MLERRDLVREPGNGERPRTEPGREQRARLQLCRGVSWGQRGIVVEGDQLHEVFRESPGFEQETSEPRMGGFETPLLELEQVGLAAVETVEDSRILRHGAVHQQRAAVRDEAGEEGFLDVPSAELVCEPASGLCGHERCAPERIQTLTPARVARKRREE